MPIARRPVLAAVPRMALVLVAPLPVAAFAARPDAGVPGKERKAPLVAVVGKGNPLTDISMNQLRSVFLGNLVQDDQGHRLTPINLPPGSPDRVCFDRVILSMAPEEAGRYWVDRRARGLGMPPRFFESSVLIQKLVARFPGLVGYARADELLPEVQILRIDHKAAGDPAYALARCES